MRYRVSCAGEDVLGYLPKGGYFDDPDEAIVRADYAGACVFDTLTGDYSLTPECDEEIESAKARPARRWLVMPTDETPAKRGETRIRRGKVVIIPEEWRGKVTDRQTIRKRPSKLTRKARNAMMRHWRPGGWIDGRKRTEGRAPKAEEWE